jgi:hypothetical protein
VISRATAPTLRLTIMGVTFSSRRCSHSAARTSSPSLHGRVAKPPDASQGSGRVTTISCLNSSKTMAPAKASSELSAVMTLASLRSGCRG